MSHVRFWITRITRITPTAGSTLECTRKQVRASQKGDPGDPGDPYFDMTREKINSHESCQILDHPDHPDHPYRR
jgi:hypothetical protein